MKQYTFRIESPAQLARWRRAAKAKKRTLADWMRLALDAAAANAEPEAEQQETQPKRAAGAR
jgi:hypothetical protein